MYQFIKYFFPVLWISFVCYSCAKKDSGSGNTTPPPVPPSNFSLSNWTIDNKAVTQPMYYGISKSPVITLHFAAPINHTSVANAISYKENSGAAVSYAVSYQNGDSVLLVQPTQPLSFLKSYVVTISKDLKSLSGGTFNTATTINFNTGIDSTNKFPIINDSALLNLVQQQTFKYFWDFGHPVSGLARERNTSGETVTSGGSGFGIMAIVVAVERGFITRAQGLQRMQTIVSFLKNTA